MNSTEFWQWVDCQMPDHLGVPVHVVDEDGFVHHVESLHWDEESNAWIIRTVWKGHE